MRLVHQLIATVLILSVGTTSTMASEVTVEPKKSKAAVDSLATFLKSDRDQRAAVSEQSFANVSLTKNDSARAAEMLYADGAAHIKKSRAKEMKERQLRDGDLVMPFYYRIFGEKPKTGRSMYISLHGGGGAPKRVNDQQWENQKRLYRLEEGVYVVPRAPTNTWNLWHQAHIDWFFQRLIENMIVIEGVDPNRVYVMGYSAGGDGVYQLAPRMADRWAAAAMMAGHPNETSPLGLRNIAFTIHVGGRDSGYNRNKVAEQWKQKLAALRKGDQDGYVHLVKIYPNKGHWMDREDAAAIPWMAKFQRNPFPNRVVWRQDDVVHSRFYWLAVDPKDVKGRAEVIAEIDRQSINIQSSGVGRLKLRFNDRMVNLDQPIQVNVNGKSRLDGRVRRTIATINTSLKERLDPKCIFSGQIVADLGDDETD